MPIAITLFVKNPDSKNRGKILFHDVGDYLSRGDKLQKLIEFKSIQGITEKKGWVMIQPDQHNDWINQRDNSFGEFISIRDKKDKDSILIFENYSRGLETARDAWIYNFSKKGLSKNINITIDAYNKEIDRFSKLSDTEKQKAAIDDFVNHDPAQISWSSSLLSYFKRNQKSSFDQQSIAFGLYRPFVKEWLYYSQIWNHRVGQMPRIFPDATTENLVICVTGIGSTKDFSSLISDTLPDLELISKSQCFPLYLYNTDENEADSSTEEFLFASAKTNKSDSKRKRRDAITDAGLYHFQEKYPKEKITKEDLFYYIYGLLHSPEYREKYANNLSKELPRIPAVKSASDFRTFEKAAGSLQNFMLITRR